MNISFVSICLGHCMEACYTYFTNEQNYLKCEGMYRNQTAKIRVLRLVLLILNEMSDAIVDAKSAEKRFHRKHPAKLSKIWWTRQLPSESHAKSRPAITLIEEYCKESDTVSEKVQSKKRIDSQRSIIGEAVSEHTLTLACSPLWHKTICLNSFTFDSKRGVSAMR